MLDLSAKAQEKLTEYIEKNRITAYLRVSIIQSCSGPSLALSLDEKKKDDEVIEQDGLTFLVEKNLLEHCGEIIIDYVEAGANSGFSIQSANPIPNEGGECSSGSCGACSCGN